MNWRRQIGLDSLDLIEFSDEVVDLLNSKLSCIVFVEDLEYRLILLLVNRKTIRCHD